MNRLFAVVVLLAGVFLSAPYAQAAEDKDCVEKRVCDKAAIFTPAQIKNLSDYHTALLERYDMDYRVAVLPDAGEIGLKAAQLFKAADVGAESKSRKGVLLLIDPAANAVRIEISAGLDAVYTDGFVAYLQQRQMVPFFKAGRVADGILATTEMIVTRAQGAQAGHEFIPPEQLPQNLAIGAGAQTDASIGTGYVAPAGTAAPAVRPQGLSPEDVVVAYHKALADKNASPDLDIYSRATQEMKRKWVVTPAQMANELRAYKSCDIDKTVYVGTQKMAVVRFKVDQRKCAPYFMVYEGDAWRLDFKTMMENIRFNIDNDWRFDMQKALPYVDAFDDWSFNKDGYPFPLRKMRWGLTINTNYRTSVTTVSKIYTGTPAESMGLQVGDVILSWGGYRKPDHKKVVTLMDRAADGEQITVEVMRDGLALAVTLTAPPKL